MARGRGVNHLQMWVASARFFFCGLFRRGERKVTYTIVTHYVLRICTGHTGLGCWLARAERLSDNGQGFFQPLVLASNDATLSGLRLGQVVHANFQRCEALPCSLAGQVVVENVCFFFCAGWHLRALPCTSTHLPTHARLRAVIPPAFPSARCADP